jgi:hypothetical protein
MKKFLQKISLTLVMGMITLSTTAQVTVAGSATGNGSYATLADAIAAVPLAGQEGNNITVEISASTTETATTTIGNGNWATLKIYPTIDALTCSDVYILLSGAKNVTIDGRVNATGTPAVGDATCLILSSTSTANPVIQFNNDAQSNTVKYCSIKIGALPNTTGGIVFGATAVADNGNGLNVIDHNFITSSGATYPTYAIWATGNTTKPNKGNQITNNEFTNVMAAGSAAIAILVLGNATSNINDNYTISGNSIYAATVTTNSGGNRFFIQVGSLGNGGSHTITGNYIGGSSAQCGGSKMSKAGTVVSNFIGISLTTSATGASLVQNNTIKNINWTSYAGNQNFTGIMVAGSGDATISENVIGDNSTSGYSTTASIIHSATGANASTFNGITITTTGTVTCQTNQIGSIKAFNNGASATGAMGFNGISKSNAGTTTIANNLIGSLTAPYSINDSTNNTTTFQNQNTTGIDFRGTGTVTISNNTIANLTNKTNIGTMRGIFMFGNGSTGTVNGNFIHSNTIIGATTAINYGIWCNIASTNTLSNNIISLGDNNPYEIRGISDVVGTNNIYHNTVYLSGMPSTLALNSACLYSAATTARNYKNNILFNARSNNGATGNHYALNITTAGSIAVDYNNYFVNGTDGVLGSYAGDITSLPIVTDNDASSVNSNPNFANAGGTAAVDYKPAVGIQGQTGTGVDFDFAGTARTNATIGAYEIINVSTGLVSNNSDYKIFTGSSAIRITGDITDLPVSVYNSIGKCVKSITATQSDITIDLPSKGVYIVRVGSSAKKLIVQ